MEPWTDEAFERRAGLIRAALAACGETCGPLEPLGRGWDHDVLLEPSAGRVWRLPRSEAVAATVAREFALLPVLAPRLPLTIPTPERLLPLPAPELGPALASRWLPGRDALAAAADPALRATWAAPLGRLVRALHDLPLASLPVVLPTDPLGRFDTAVRTPRSLERLHGLVAAGHLKAEVEQRLVRLLEGAPRLPPPGPLVPTHADLHPRNLLVDAEGRLSAAIDWVDLHAGPPACDLAAALFQTVPPAGWRAFLDAYGTPPPLTLAWARWRAVDHAIGGAHGCLARGDVPFAAWFLRVLETLGGRQESLVPTG